MKIERNKNFRLEKKISIPEKFKFKNKYKGTYPFDRMKIGDSFVAGEYTEKLQHSVLRLARHFVNYYGLKSKFSTRKTKQGKLRVWRIK